LNNSNLGYFCVYWGSFKQGMPMGEVSLYH
jgi:hypothetical protein